jgi:Zn-dependent M16 (insulinase) family peptidase
MNENARIANQIKKLGPEGLKEVERKLETAKEDNNKTIPMEMLTSFPVPDVKSIFCIPVQTVQEPGIGRSLNPRIVSTNGELQKHIESDGDPLPFFVEYDHVEACILFLSSHLSLFFQQSDFVSIHAFFSLAKLPNHLRPYMHVYLSAFFSLPVVRHNGIRLTHEDVVNQLYDDTVECGAQLGVQLGVCDLFSNIFHVHIQVELAGYETAVAWLRDLVYGSEFDKERCVFLLIHLWSI